MHTTPFLAPAGFDERYVVENKDRYLQGASFIDEWDKALIARKLTPNQAESSIVEGPITRNRWGHSSGDYDEDLQSDNFVGGFTKHWIEHQQFTGPLFLQIGFPGPHPPYDPTLELARVTPIANSAWSIPAPASSPSSHFRCERCGNTTRLSITTRSFTY